MNIEITKDTIQYRFVYGEDDYYHLSGNTRATDHLDRILEVAMERPEAKKYGHYIYILQLAGMIENTTFEDYSVDFNQLTHTIRRRVNKKAFDAYRNLSNDEEFSGTIYEFAERLVGYATLYQEALIAADIYPMEPYCGMMASVDPMYPLSKDMNYRLPPEHRFPALDSILDWASDYGKYCQLYNYLLDEGIDSMVEAFKIGVPIEDIVV